MERWALVFQISAVLGFFATIIFSLFGSGKAQPWNEPKKNEEIAHLETISLKEPLNQENAECTKRALQ